MVVIKASECDVFPRFGPSDGLDSSDSWAFIKAFDGAVLSRPDVDSWVLAGFSGSDHGSVLGDVKGDDVVVVAFGGGVVTTSHEDLVFA